MSRLVLRKTCESSPEQYDAYLGKQMVGYLRLRFGNYSVRYPDASGEVIFRHYFPDEWLGFFENEDQRQSYLDQGSRAILKHMGLKPNQESFVID